MTSQKLNKTTDTDDLEIPFYSIYLNENGKILEGSNGFIPEDVLKIAETFKNKIKNMKKSVKYYFFEIYLIISFILFLLLSIYTLGYKKDLYFSISALLLIFTNYLTFDSKRIVLRNMLKDLIKSLKDNEGVLLKEGFEANLGFFYGPISKENEAPFSKLFIKLEFNEINDPMLEVKINKKPKKKNITRSYSQNPFTNILGKYHVLGLDKDNSNGMLLYYPKSYKFKSFNSPNVYNIDGNIDIIF